MENKQRDKEYFDRLLSGIVGGDRRALAALYEALKTPVYGLALSIVKERETAEDVMQDTFVRVWEMAGQYRPGSDGRAWVMAIARNKALGVLRARRRTAEWAEREEQTSARDEIAPLLDRLLLEELLSSLDITERQIVMLYATCGYSQKEIAQLLGRNYATVRWKFSNAMKKLSRLAEEQEPGRQEMRVLLRETMPDAL